ncbi:unnamed protein product [Albugo candida]|uniref:Ketoreductase (KR) domain-containing protein n=1 Tax=Albugo candida TaxID=65357 RepID=A0A024GMA1_9STRA|nr:unnamed protein product [Albugo candida]|eukprot:CCI47863.1 unnamed protein product [Albugo candida]
MFLKWHQVFFFGILSVLVPLFHAETIYKSVQLLFFSLFLLNCFDLIIRKYQLWDFEPLAPTANGYALVNDSSTDIGREMVFLLAEKKYSMILVSRSQSTMENMKIEMELVNKVRVFCCFADTSTQDGINKVIAYIRENQFRIDILINIASLIEISSFVQLTREDAQKWTQATLAATVHLTHAFLPMMIRRKKGSILNVTSMKVAGPIPGRSLESALHAAIDMLTQAINYDLRNTGVVVSSYYPGPLFQSFEKEGSLSHAYDIKGIAKCGLEEMYNGNEGASDSTWSRLVIYILQSFIPTRVRLGLLSGLQTWLYGRKKYSMIRVSRSQSTMENMKIEMELVNKVRVFCCFADTSTQDGINKVIAYIRENQFRIDILINIASPSEISSFVQLTREDAQKWTQATFAVTVHLTHAFLPMMIRRKKGSILNVTSMKVAGPIPGRSLESALHAAIDMLTQAINYDLRNTGVVVSSYYPGPLFRSFEKEGSLSHAYDIKGIAKRGLEEMYNGNEGASDSTWSRLVIYILQSFIPTRVRLGILSGLQTWLYGSPKVQAASGPVSQKQR